ncbi:MAG: hypothetical protein KJZ95_20090 [Caldilinea sp.]|nr:hypothetical protein [Caldilinea sp.]
MSNAPVTFHDLLSQKQWDNYSEFISEAPSYYQQELQRDIARERHIRETLRKEVLEKKYKLRRYEDLLPKAEEMLLTGQVTAVDGTVSTHQTLSGVRCQIGVVAVNYFNQKLRQSYYISEASFQHSPDDVVNVLKAREFGNRPLSSLVIRALMLYREREVALRPEYQNAHRMLHGPLLPFELMTGLGRLRALYTTLELLKRIVADPKIFSVVSTSRQSDYITLGTALNPGEYLVDEQYTFGDEIADNQDFMSPGRWREREFDHMKDFLRRNASKILVGIIRVGHRPYIFHAHRDNFELAAAIIARDSLMQREKGFPLLIDYADTLCSEYFPAGDFTQMMRYQLAREGEFLVESDERDLRMK